MTLHHSHINLTVLTVVIGKIPGHTLVYKEDGTPVYICDSNHSSHRTMESVSAAASFNHHISNDFDPRSSNNSLGGGNILSPHQSGVKSVEMNNQRGVPSPFGSSPTTTVGTNLNRDARDYRAAAVVLPRGIPSPFLDTGTNTQKTSGGLKSLKSIDEGTATTTGISCSFQF